MVEAFISILLLLAASSTMMGCAANENVGKDGFNFYKDYLRGGRSDDGVAIDPTSDDRLVYFYRTPLQVHSRPLEQDYRKRTGNAFKNHMLSKEMLGDSRVERLSEKRTSKQALSFIMAKLHPNQIDDQYMDVELIPVQ